MLRTVFFSLLALIVLLAISFLPRALITAPVPAEPTSHEAALVDLQAPWSCGSTYRISQGHEGTTHDGWGRYAWDFSTPEGTLLRAPAAGVIRALRDDSQAYGCDPRFAWDANYAVIDLEDGHDVLLLHLQPGSALVKEGQRVEVGDPIARVGNSGWVCGTHLHLQVQRTCRSWWCPSQPATLQGETLERGALLTRTCDES